MEEHRRRPALDVRVQGDEARRTIRPCDPSLACDGSKSKDALTHVGFVPAERGRSRGCSAENDRWGWPDRRGVGLRGSSCVLPGAGVRYFPSVTSSFLTPAVSENCLPTFSSRQHQAERAQARSRQTAVISIEHRIAMSDTKYEEVPSGPPPNYEKSTQGKLPLRQNAPIRPGPKPLEIPILKYLRSKRVVLASASPRRKQLLGQASFYPPTRSLALSRITTS